MNVFIVGTPLETAAVLDTRRLRKQIIECGQMLAALDGKTKFWRNHPALCNMRITRRGSSFTWNA